MCPACFAAAAWAVVGTTSAGGVTALVARKLRGKRPKGAPPNGGTHAEPVKSPPERRES
jgi:hypothetical protein